MRSLFLSLLLVIVLGSCSQNPAPVSHYGFNKGAGSAGIHTVVEGDTLWSVSNRYQIAMQDIAKANRMTAPFRLVNGMRLSLPAPREYTVREGDTLYEVSRLFAVNTSDVARLNDLQPPYQLHAGQVLRMPPPTEEPPSQAVQVAQAEERQESEPVKPGQKPAASKAKKKVTARTPKRASKSTFEKPVDGRVISSYGPKKNGLHNDGINILAAKGTPVRSAENGVVVYAGNELKGSGNLVLVRHDDRYMTAYAHLDKINIERGAVIKRGQTIGTVGKTGAVSEPQLHFEIRRGTKAIDPKRYISG